MYNNNIYFYNPITIPICLDSSLMQQYNFNYIWITSDMSLENMLHYTYVPSDLTMFSVKDIIDTVLNTIYENTGGTCSLFSPSSYCLVYACNKYPYSELSLTSFYPYEGNVITMKLNNN